MKTLEELRKVFVEARKIALEGDSAKIDLIVKNLKVLSDHCNELVKYETEYSEKVKAKRIYDNIEKVREAITKEGYNSKMVIKFFGLPPKKVEAPQAPIGFPVSDDLFASEENNSGGDLSSMLSDSQAESEEPQPIELVEPEFEQPIEPLFEQPISEEPIEFVEPIEPIEPMFEQPVENDDAFVDLDADDYAAEFPYGDTSDFDSIEPIEPDDFQTVSDIPMVKSPVTETSIPEKHDSNQESDSPEAKILESGNVNNSEFKFDWDSLPSINFEDVAGLETVKETVKIKVLLPLKNPEAFEGYVKKNGGGLLLYGPPGTGKTMIAAAIANEIGAKFCSVKPSDLIHQGAGQSEKAVRALFAQARSFPCSVIYFDEMDSISPKTTRSQYAKQMRSELLAQLQGIDSYKKENEHILFLIAATNKPWEIDSAFLRPGRFGTRIYVGLPDSPARKYMFEKRLEKIKAKGLVSVNADIDMDALVAATEGFNGSDISNLIDRVEEISILRGIESGEKYISYADFELALSEIPSSVQREDIEKLMEWKAEI